MIAIAIIALIWNAIAFLQYRKIEKLQRKIEVMEKQQERTEVFFNPEKEITTVKLRDGKYAAIYGKCGAGAWNLFFKSLDSGAEIFLTTSKK